MPFRGQPLTEQERRSVFARTPEETQRAYDLFVRGTGGGMAELAICADCGVWDRWDSDLDRYGRCVDGKAHLAARVVVLAISPSDSHEHLRGHSAWRQVRR